jgi:high-affinity iron transporter
MLFPSALIVFREVLEAALVITIVMAATRGLPRRNIWVATGIAGGITGASAVAALMSMISARFDGAGAEIVNAAILFTAVTLIGWHVVWMNSHGREIVDKMRAVGKSVVDGEKHMSILAIVVGLAVLREGSEIVLLLKGLWISGSAITMLGGGALGLVGGALTGALIYMGLLRLPVGRVFALTNVLLVLIAAGMAARGARFLVQADLLPSLGGRVWDTSGILSDESVPGQIFAGLIGYMAKPSGIELAFYVATIFVVLMLMLFADALMKRGTASRA